MLVLPIVNRDRILNVCITLKDAVKIRVGVHFSDSKESEVVVNGKKISESVYGSSKDINALLDFVRSNSLTSKKNFLITTREESESSLYDVYEVAQPPKRINDSLDNLYSMALIDMQKEIPNIKKGKYVSFEKLGFGEYITDERVSKFKEVVDNSSSVDKSIIKLFDEAGVMDLYETLDFFNNFDFTVISSSSISEEEFQKVLNSLENIHTRDAKNLRSYYNMALSNKEIYSRISSINKIVYDKPLSLIQSESQRQKRLIKVNNCASNVSLAGEDGNVE